MPGCWGLCEPARWVLPLLLLLPPLASRTATQVPSGCAFLRVWGTLDPGPLLAQSVQESLSCEGLWGCNGQLARTLLLL